MTLSNHTLVPSTNTAPLPRETVSSPANRSPVLAASVLAAASWDSPSTLMPNAGRSFSLGHVVEVFCTQNETSGGSRDTGTKVLAANPTRTPSTSAAMAMTPDGKCPNASRSDAGLRSMLVMTPPSSHVTVGRGDVRVRPQPALPGVAAVHREDPLVRRVGGDAASVGGQLVGQRQHRELGVEPRVEEVGHRDALDARESNPVLGGAQVAPAGELELLPDVDDERTPQRVDLDPRTVAAADLQPAGTRFGQQQGEHAGVAVRSYALTAVSVCGIADYLDQRRGGLRERRVEHVLGAFQRCSPVPQQL